MITNHFDNDARAANLFIPTTRFLTYRELDLLEEACQQGPPSRVYDYPKYLALHFTTLRLVANTGDVDITDFVLFLFPDGDMLFSKTHDARLAPAEVTGRSQEYRLSILLSRLPAEADPLPKLEWMQQLTGKTRTLLNFRGDGTIRITPALSKLMHAMRSWDLLHLLRGI